MHVAINCRSILKPRLTGIGRYAHHLIDWLGRVDPINKYTLYCPKRLVDFNRRLPKFDYKNVCVKSDVWNLGVKRVVGAHDIYHLPNPAPLPQGQVPVIVTVHDFVHKTYPHVHTPETVATTERHMHDIISRAAKIICTSESTRRDLHRFYTLDEGRSCRVYNGVDQKIFYPLSEEQRVQAALCLRAKGIEGPFILFVGTNEPRKNLANVLKVMVRLKEKKKFDGKLVVIGSGGWMMESFETQVDQLDLRSSVVLPGYVGDEELCYYYNLAEMFMYPSFYEGFGFPIAEALCCGAAVVTSNTSSCPEIAGEAALTVDPASIDSIYEAVDRLLQDKPLKARLKQEALIMGREFSFEKTARMTLDVYKEIYAH